jgi:hypothetical protein
MQSPYYYRPSVISQTPIFTVIAVRTSGAEVNMCRVLQTQQSLASLRG